MTLSEELDRISRVFLDTAPIIYYIEANPLFGPLSKEVVSAFRHSKEKIVTAETVHAMSAQKQAIEI